MTSPSSTKASPIMQGYRYDKYDLELGETFADHPEQVFRSIRYNEKPIQHPNTRRSTTIKRTGVGRDQAKLAIRDLNTSDPSRIATYYCTGSYERPGSRFVLIFDEDKKKVRLEVLSEVYDFNLCQSDQQVGLVGEQPDYQSYSDHEADGFMTEEEYEGPMPMYDYRHFLGRKTSSVQDSQSASTIGTASPANISSSMSSATPSQSTPQPQNRRAQDVRKKPAAASSRKRKSPEPERVTATTAKVKPKPKAGATEPKTQQPAPSIRLDRRASTRPKELNDEAVFSFTSMVSNASSNMSSFKSSGGSSTEPTPAHDSGNSNGNNDDDDDDDVDPYAGLEIDWGNGERVSRGRARASQISLERAFEGVTGDGPVSLRSATSSMSPNSQLQGKQQPTSHPRDDIIDFGPIANGKEDEEEEEEEVVLEDSEEVDFVPTAAEQDASDNGEYNDDDDDDTSHIDALTLDHHQQQQQAQPEQDSCHTTEPPTQNGTVNDDDDDDDDDRSFEESLAAAIAESWEADQNAEGEEQVVDEESEESEEE